MTVIRGEVHGATVDLERPLPLLEGRRVRLVVLPEAIADIELSPEENLALWRKWISSGPQRAIGEDEEASLG